MGPYTSVTLMKAAVEDRACNPDSYASCPTPIPAEKLKQLVEQYDCFIKADVVGYVRPSFLPPLGGQAPVNPSGSKKRGCSHCDGTGHIQPGKKRHYSDKYCPILVRRR